MVQRFPAGTLPDVEGSMILDLGLLFIDMADVREAGSATKRAGEFIEGVGRAGGVDFHVAVGEVQDVALEVQGGGGVLGEVSVSHALDASLDDPSAGGFRDRGHSTVGGPVNNV